ncbi:hypothetical protein [Tenacibaculum sp. 190524A02b]|uniref:Lipoprotein n=1 Tax=Tenacibaculum vairaonense TaxID=3137860 RepID=A0ABM9PGK8_9FLAO
MKKIYVLITVLSLVFTACTDNTTEHEELLKIQATDKEGSSTSEGESGGNGDNDEG